MHFQVTHLAGTELIWWGGTRKNGRTKKASQPSPYVMGAILPLLLLRYVSDSTIGRGTSLLAHPNPFSRQVLVQGKGKRNPTLLQVNALYRMLLPINDSLI